MTVVVTAVAPFTAEMYDAVSARAMTGDELPDGCKAHIAGPVEGGWRVITVWDSEEEFHRFREDKLMPAIREVSGEAPDAVQPQVDPVHRLITA
jgi:hypothetical protein